MSEQIEAFLNVPVSRIDLLLVLAIIAFGATLVYILSGD